MRENSVDPFPASGKSTKPGLTRRAFVGSMGAVVVSAVSGCKDEAPKAVPAEDPKEPLTIIDTHTHFYDPSRTEGVPWPPKDNKVLYRTVRPSEFLTLTKPFGVAGTVVVEASPWLEDNQWVLDLMADNPFLLGLVGNLDPGKPAFKAHLTRFAKKKKFLGIRINRRELSKSIAESGFLDDLRRLADAGRQVDVVGGPHLLPDVVRLAQQVPKLRIVLDHLPFDFPGDEKKRQPLERAFDALENHSNVYAKVSHVIRRVEGKAVTEMAAYRDKLDRIWRVFGNDRVIYGSNWPVSNLFAPYRDVITVVRDYVRQHQPQSEESYFRTNAQRAYRWPGV